VVERAVELLALGAAYPQPAGIVHLAGLAGRRFGAGADGGVLELKSGCSGDHGHGNVSSAIMPPSITRAGLASASGRQEVCGTSLEPRRECQGSLRRQPLSDR